MKAAIRTAAIVAGVGLLAVACDGRATQVSDPQPTLVPTHAPIPPTAVPMPNVHRVEIPLGGSVELSTRGVGISFDRVVEDSRCPADVVCIWAGKATVALTATEEDTSATVRTSLVPGSGIESPWTEVPGQRPALAAISIRLIDLGEYPDSDGDRKPGGPFAVLEVMIGGG